MVFGASACGVVVLLPKPMPGKPIETIDVDEFDHVEAIREH